MKEVTKMARKGDMEEHLMRVRYVERCRLGTSTLKKKRRVVSMGMEGKKDNEGKRIQ